MGIYHFLISFSIVMSFFILLISIPSMISIYRLGRRDYFRNIKLLITLYKKLNLCYELTENKPVNFVYPNGTRISNNYETTDYYLPIYIDDNNVFIVNKMYKGYFYDLRINDVKYDGENWQTDLIEIKTSICLLSQIL